jgi:DNA primase
VVESIAKIPDSIKASVFLKECSHILEIEERSLISELNKMRAAKSRKDHQKSQNYRQSEQYEPAPAAEVPERLDKGEPYETQEREIVRLLVTYGNKLINWDDLVNTYIGPFVIVSLNDVEFEHPIYREFVKNYADEIEKGNLPEEVYFINHPNKEIADIAITVLLSQYELSPNWIDMHKIHTPFETDVMKDTILGPIYHLKLQKVNKILLEITNQLKGDIPIDEQDILQSQHMRMLGVKKSIVKFLGIVYT